MRQRTQKTSSGRNHKSFAGKPINVGYKIDREDKSLHERSPGAPWEVTA